MKKVLLLAVLLCCAPAMAHAQGFKLSVDTKGIVSTAPHQYMTYVRATAASGAPVAEVLDEWNCQTKQVRRLALTIYQPPDKETGMSVGFPQPVKDTTWHPVVLEAAYEMVCKIGAANDSAATYTR